MYLWIASYQLTDMIRLSRRRLLVSVCKDSMSLPIVRHVLVVGRNYSSSSVIEGTQNRHCSARFYASLRVYLELPTAFRLPLLHLKCCGPVVRHSYAPSEALVSPFTPRRNTTDRIDRLVDSQLLLWHHLDRFTAEGPILFTI